MFFYHTRWWLRKSAYIYKTKKKLKNIVKTGVPEKICIILQTYWKVSSSHSVNIVGFKNVLSLYQQETKRLPVKDIIVVSKIMMNANLEIYAEKYNQVCIFSSC